MNFFLTTYIYPIEEPLELSKKLGFILDNPRTKEEINLVYENIKVSMDSPAEMYKYDNQYRIPIKEVNPDYVSLEASLKVFYQNSFKDKYIEEFYQKNKNDSELLQLAKMWIIARFDDEGTLTELKEDNLNDKENSFILLEEEHPLVKNSNNLISYSYLLSLLIENDGEDYFGRNFLLHKYRERIEIPKIDEKINQTILMFLAYSTRRQDCPNGTWYMSFPCIKDKIIEKTNLIERNLDKESTEILLYVAGLLKTSDQEIKDEKYRLVTYVGILELLLTHNPNFNRFNVEDSISKQFKIKVATLVYLYSDKQIPIQDIQAKLKDIYNQRSNIAHGNFKELGKYLKKLSKNDEYFDTLISDTIFYIKAVLESYLEDRDFVNFLKDS